MTSSDWLTLVLFSPAAFVLAPVGWYYWEKWSGRYHPPGETP